MNRVHAWMSVAVLATLVPGGSVVKAEDAPPALRLRGRSIDMNNRVKTDFVDIVVDRWSTDEERAKLQGVILEKGGDDALLSAIQKTQPCGWARANMKLRWDIRYCRKVDLPDGGVKVVLGTDRPVSTWEVTNSTRSDDYQFSLAELRLNKDMKGEGKFIRAAMVHYDKEKNTLDIENYQREPVRLTQLEPTGGDKDDKKKDDKK